MGKVRGNPRFPVPKIARGNNSISNSFGTGKQYPDGSVSSRKKEEARPVPGRPKGATFKVKTPGGGRVGTKPTGRVPVKRKNNLHK